jgi:hopanoid C-2 methylase
MASVRRSVSGKKNVLIVNCYFDDCRGSVRRPGKVPYAMGPVYLAGAFSSLCDVRLYNEVASGPLEDAQLLGWPDMLVLTGLTNGFDRMLHLTAYARTSNPRVIVVAGGPAIRALPVLSRRFFDYVCTGDIEELGDVITEAFGRAFTVDEMQPRFDLAYWIGSMGHVEASRACNFRCSFCSLTGEGRKYQSYPLEYLRQQVLAMGRKRRLFFVDNNFYGVDRRVFFARVSLVKQLRQEGYFKDWGALVTNDCFHAEENLERMRDAGCTLLFSGVESFDTAWLQDVNKLQNLRYSPVGLITKCLEMGIMFAYGLILDVTTRRIADLRRELDFVVGTPEIPLPGFLTLPIPLLGTPFFRECLAGRAFLPETKLRDMDGSTLVLRPLDPVDQATAFIRDVLALRGYRRRALLHAVRFAHRYRSTLSPVQLTLAMGSAGLLCADGLITGLRRGSPAGRIPPRTHLTTTEALDPMYTPAFRVGSQYERYFTPTMVTDARGDLTADLAELASLPTRQRSSATAGALLPNLVSASRTSRAR